MTKSCKSSGTRVGALGLFCKEVEVEKMSVIEGY